MKIPVVIGLVLFCCYNCFAQNLTTLSNESILRISATGIRLEKKLPSEPKGVTSLPAENCEAVLKTNDGKLYKHVNGRIDLITGRFIFTDNEEEYMCTAPLLQIVFDSCNTEFKSAVFESGFPPVGKQDNKTLYRVLTTGRAMLLKYYTCEAEDNSQPYHRMSNGQTYNMVEQYYLYTGSQMFRLGKNTNNLPKLLGINAKDLHAQHIDVKQEGGAIELVNYYNTTRSL